MCQNLQVQVEELKTVNESLNLSVEELYKARALVETTLRERDELISARCKKTRLLEEQSKTFYEVHSEFDSETVLDTQDNSEKDLILSLQTQVKDIVELVEMGNKVKRFDEEKKAFEIKISKLENVLAQRVKDFDDAKTELSRRTDKFETDGYVIEGELKEYEDSCEKSSVQVFYKCSINIIVFQDISSATLFHGVQDEKRVWFEVELHGAQGDREAEGFQFSNDDTVVTQRQLEDKQLEDKTNTDCLVNDQEKVHLGINVGANITVTRVPGQKGA
nr:hypothetical protein [Tanacetum cinerariifolium]